MSAVFDHLWQSTLFAVVLGLLTFAFRRNAAGVRYWIWFAASLKFLIPFSVLIALGETLFRLLAPAYATPLVFYRVAAAARPFSDMRSVVAAPAAPDLHLTTLALAIWFCGFVALSGLWLVRWSRLHALVRDARAVSLAPPLPVKLTAAAIEPGLVGILRPVLLLPQGILERLSAEELAAIEAHERCHLRRRDNLTAAIHMTITNLFWFHPLLWWIGGRLIAERERACDEAVLDCGNVPEIYAGSILKVCGFYLPSPLACAAGVSGANLKRRMETIMENRTTLRLNAIKKVLLAAVSVAAVAAPVAIGFAVSSDAAGNSPQSVQERLAEQRRPRTEIALDPAAFDKFAGYYRMNGNVIYVVSRKGDAFYAGAIGDAPVRIYPDSSNEFFIKGLDLPAQYSFTIDASGHVSDMVLHQSGEEIHAPRIADADGKAAEAGLAARIAANRPSPGTGDALRHQIEGLMNGEPDYDRMAPTLAAGTRQMIGQLHAMVAPWGPVTAVTFVRVAANGMDVYDVTCRNKRTQWEIAPLTVDGKISGIFLLKDG